MDSKDVMVNVGGYGLFVSRFTGMGSLTDLWSIGNAHRLKRGLEPLDLRNWLRRPQTEEFVRVVEKYMGLEDRNAKKSEIKDGYIPTVKSVLIRAKKGRYGGTDTHWYIMLDAALYLAEGTFKLSIFNAIADMEQIISSLEKFEVPQEVAEAVQKPLYVYAIRETSTGNVKLGISIDPYNRLKQLQIGNSSNLELMAFKQVNSYQDEKMQHRLNQEHHVRGEWFNSNAALIDINE